MCEFNGISKDQFVAGTAASNLEFFMGNVDSPTLKCLPLFEGLKSLCLVKQVLVVQSLLRH